MFTEVAVFQIKFLTTLFNTSTLPGQLAHQHVDLLQPPLLRQLARVRDAKVSPAATAQGVPSGDIRSHFGVYATQRTLPAGVSRNCLLSQEEVLELSQNLAYYFKQNLFAPTPTFSQTQL